MMSLPKIVAVIGPTASGKTALGVSLCQQFNGELISADAKQVYRGMDIGTAKEKDLPVPQHLIDILNPGQKITVGEYQKMAYRVIDEVLAAEQLPVLVGGSGLYVESVTDGYLFGGPGSREKQPRYNVLKIGIQLEREELLARVQQRTARWLEEGLLTEIKDLFDKGVSPKWLDHCGLEYRYFTQHILGNLSLEEAEKLTNIALRQFIKRQYTWWRRHSDVHWVKETTEAITLTKAFLASS